MTSPVFALLAAIACATTFDGAPGLDECGALSGTAREDCRFAEARRVSADPAALDLTLRAVEDPLARDLLLVRLAFDAPTSSARFCSKVTTDLGKQRCQQIVGRPHLRGSP